MSLPRASREVLGVIKRGVVIPACPLALDAARKLDEKHQVALLRYYVAAGVGAVAIGVHTTQFEIRDPAIALFAPLLTLAAQVIAEMNVARPANPVVRISGICGPTKQATAEAELAASLGYDVGMLSLSALRDATEDDLIAHCKSVSRIIPLMGFYLQPAVGGRILPYSFWRRFVEIENVVAIKVAPFNRYHTLDVVRGVALAGRESEVTLYTGNDDNIIADLLTPYPVATPEGTKTLRIKGGLLGQWSVWTKKAVELLGEIHALGQSETIPTEILLKNAALTDANAAVFDTANNFAGCIPGVHEVLRRQGLLGYSHCLDPKVGLSPGQADEISRVCRDYPWLTDDEFIAEHLGEWLP